MSVQVQFKRGTTAHHSTFTGADGHQIAETPTSDYQVSRTVFRGIIDYIISKQVYCPTISQWYDNLF